MDKKHGTENLHRVLLEEVIKSHLLANPKTIPEIRDSEDCCQGFYSFFITLVGFITSVTVPLH